MISNLILTIKRYFLEISGIGLIFFLGFVSFGHPKMSQGCPIPKSKWNQQFYSQYFEDYILSIFFEQIKQGHYIDVGANDPNHDSVTKYFYLKGWRGINIEPIHKQYLKLMAYRPNDLNLNIGIANHSKNMVLSVIFKNNKELDYDGLSTFDPTVLKQALHDGYSFESVSVPAMSLNEVLKADPLLPIHFIKIDVEGMEAEVLKSIDLTKYRPWVFIIEATKPRTFIRSDAEWKPILIAHNYVEVMFDGLNSYYVAKEHYKLLQQPITKAYNCASEANKKFNVINNSSIAIFP